MIKFVLKRIGSALVLLLVVSALIFAACEILPGDVAQVMLSQSATAENVRALRAEFGLDQPAWLRYLHWLVGAVHFDWGQSITTHTPVAAMLSERMINTLLLAGVTTLISVPLAIGLGLLMAVRAGSRFDRGASMSVLGLSATPEFLIATLGVLLFAVKLHWLPAVSYLSLDSGFVETTRALLLPVLTLTIIVTSQIARMTRAIIGNILGQPYIEMATLKGIRRRRVVLSHSLRNAVGPLANVVALNVAYLVSSVMVVETVFAYPGLASLLVNAVQARDLPVVQACALVFCAAYIVLIMIADIIAHVCDPRNASKSQEGAV